MPLLRLSWLCHARACVRRPTVLFMSAVLPCAPLAAATPFDPVSEDPIIADAKHPMRMQTLTFPSGDALCHATYYGAQGSGPHPTIVLLHGMPGMDGNRDFARVFQRTGYNVLYFYYRGMWGSPGDFSFANAVSDVKSALAFLRSEKFRTNLRVDSTRLILVGHSFGGWTALLGAAADPDVREVISIAGSNEAEDMRVQLRSAGSREALLAAIQVQVNQMTSNGPIHTTRAVPDTEAFIEHLESYDLVQQAGRLRDRRLLLIKGTRDRVVPPDRHHEPLVAALRQAGASALETAEFDDDHSFSTHRLALARRLVQWLGPPRPPAP